MSMLISCLFFLRVHACLFSLTHSLSLSLSRTLFVGMSCVSAARCRRENPQRGLGDGASNSAVNSGIISFLKIAGLTHHLDPLPSFEASIARSKVDSNPHTLTQRQIGGSGLSV